MATKRLHRLAWELARRQHWVISREQLLELGFTPSAIRHRIAKGRLHPIHRGVYAVGRCGLTREGYWMAAALRCGDDAYLSHMPGAAHWGMCRPPQGRIDISVRVAVVRTPPGIRVHRRRSLTDADVTVHEGIPITTPARTLIDLATILPAHRLEAAVNEADALELIDPETLRLELDSRKGQPGVRPLRALLDRHTFRLTDSELERRFLRIVRRAGLPLPETQTQLAGRTRLPLAEPRARGRDRRLPLPPHPRAPGA